MRRFWKIPTKLLGGTRRFQVGSKREKETKVPEKVVGKWMRSQLSSQSCTQCSHCWGIAHKRAFFFVSKENSPWNSTPRLPGNFGSSKCWETPCDLPQTQRVSFCSGLKIRSFAENFSFFSQEMLFVGCYLSTE